MLYVSDEREPSFAQVEGFLALRKLGLEEVVCLLPGQATGWETRFADHAIGCKIHVEETLSVSGILERARKEDISLITVNFKGRSGRHSRPSFTRALIRSSNAPLLLMSKDIPNMKIQERGIFDHVIFPTDWSPISEKSMAYLLNFNQLIRELEIVAVISNKLSVRDMRNLKKRLSETRRIFLDEGIDAEAHVYAGKPSEEIMLASKDYDATSIIMGTSCRPSFKEIFSRSCSYRVAEEAAVPTLVVPSTEGRVL